MNANVRVEEKSAGLFSGATSNPVPLEGVKVHAEIVGHASRVTMAQRFRNAEKVPIEAVYVFPLPEAAAVAGLTLRVGDRVIEGEVEERDKAFERYDDAMAAGHGAVLLDAERPNVFTISAGNILPGQEVIVELRWVAELRMEGPAIRFVLPTTVAPRYAPDADRAGVSPTPAERLNPPVDFAVPYGLELGVDISLPCPVRTIDSPSHPVRIELDGSKARVALSQQAAAMDRDFVLLVTPLESGRPQVLVERNEDGLVTAAVSLVPQLPESATRNEVILLVDRSGSMGGSSIEQVRAALHLCLRSLREGDLFNIVGFGSTFVSLFPKSVPYEQGSLEKASAHVDGLDADMGGTEILPALRAVLEREPPAGVRRQVVLLTDGEVTNEPAVIELAEEHAAHTRIFTFGIGYGASEHLVGALARVTMGEAEFIHPGERIEPKVLRQFARLGTPVLREVRVQWSGADAKLQAPHRPRAIFDGEAATVYARFEPGRAVTVSVSAQAEGKPVSWSVPVDTSAADAGDLLATLAARAAIRDLEEGTSALHDSLRGSAQRGRREARVAKEIVALAKAHHLASSQTSFVAIERREGAEHQPAAELRRVPVALTKGWGATDRMGPRASLVHAMAAPAAMLSPLRAATRAFNATLRASAPPGERAGGEADRDADVPMLLESHVADALVVRDGSAQQPAEQPHLAVARLQRADGSWRLDEKLATVLGVALASLRAAAKTIGSGRDAERVVATLAALRFLERTAGDARDEWRLLAEKAERWLKAAFASCPAGSRDRLEARLGTLMP